MGRTGSEKAWRSARGKGAEVECMDRGEGFLSPTMSPKLLGGPEEEKGEGRLWVGGSEATGGG